MIHAYLRMARLTVIASSFLPLLIAVGSSAIQPEIWSAALAWQLLGLGAVAVAFGVLVSISARRWEDGLVSVSAAQAADLDGVRERWLDPAILVSAALSLYLELVIIRWLATEYPVLSFYKNYSLLSCFAGLGLGYAMSREEHVPLPLVPPMLAWTLFILLFLRYGLGEELVILITYFAPVTEQLNMGISVGFSQLMLAPQYLFLAVAFLLTALVFIPVGQLCGRLMERRPKLRAYGLNLLGSLLGVGLSFATSVLWTSPKTWFAVAFGMLIPFSAFRRGLVALGAGFALLGLLILAWPTSALVHRVYSPYQLIERSTGENGLMEIKAAGHYHQRVHDLSRDSAGRRDDEKIRSTANYYEFPFRALGKPRSVAVVGAGTGNDVAAALRMGAGKVDAIEIDPAILELGRQYHPEKPYDDVRVTPVVNDARTFFKTTDERYDLIVYGLLDSHTLLSHASSVRIDSFVYTVEGLTEARARLRDGGMLSLSFCLLTPELGRKIFLMMKQAFDGQDPVCIQAEYDQAVIFLQRLGRPVTLPAGLLAESGFRDIGRLLEDPDLKADVSTDDWPFFYMPRRVYPFSYLPMAALVLLLSVLLLRMARRGGLRPSNAVFFLLGAGFMLIETKAITELGLTFGNTWQVIGIAIAGVLVMAFFANWAVARFSLSRAWIFFILLLGSLGGGLAVGQLGGLSPGAWGKLGTVLVLTCPMFFSGVIFSSLLKQGGDISGVMAANLLGSMVGGLLEYNSMYFGFGFLYYLGMGLYVLAFGLALWRRPGGRVPGGRE